MDIQTITDTIRTKVGENSGLGATIKFDCGDFGIIHVDGASSPNSVINDDRSADCTISLKPDVLSDLLSGDIDPTAAFMQGKLKVDGDMSVAMRLGSIL